MNLEQTPSPDVPASLLIVLDAMSFEELLRLRHRLHKKGCHDIVEILNSQIDARDVQEL